MSKPIFLTHQTLKLLDNLTRELIAGQPISLLHGDPGTGKTRILQELAHNRMSKSEVHWIELSTRDSGDESKQDRSAQVDAAFNAASNGDIIIADHFDSAIQKTRHQLFLRWATEGVKKNLKLIIATNTEGFNELSQLSQQYQMHVKNFQVMPFNHNEVKLFLGFYLFPNHPPGKLSIPGDLRVQFAVTHGIIGQIIEIAEREGARVEYKPVNKPQPIRRKSRAIIPVMGLFALVIAVGLFYLSSWDKLPESTPVVVNESSMQAVVTEPEVRVAAEPEVDVVNEVVPESEPEIAGESEIDVWVEVIPEPITNSTQTSVTKKVLEVEVRVVAEPEVGVVDEVVPEPDPEIAGESEIDVLFEVIPESITDSTQTSVTKTVPEVEARPVRASEAEIISDTDFKIDSQDQAAITQQPGTVTNLPVVKAEEMNTTGSARTDASADEVNLSGPARFQRQLQASMEWINHNDNSIGTIQIMLLSFENFDVKGFYKYVDNLATQQVDISKLRIFKTYTGTRKTYSVFYGEYESWKAAGNAKSNLPEVLRKKSPIQRSVGGIIKEIRQFEAEN